MSAALRTVGGQSEGETRLPSLLARVAGGDDTAFSRLYDLTSRRVFGVAIRILRDREAAEEATLEAYSTVWRHAARFDPRKGNALAWILLVARSRAIDQLRAQRRRSAKEECGLDPSGEPEDPSPSPEEASAHSQRCTRLKAALAALPPVQRVAIETAYFAGLSYGEVAAQLGEPLGTVKSRIRLGLCSLRRILAEVD